MAYLPHYDEEDNAFYGRALPNYPEHLPVRKRPETVWAHKVRVRRNPNAPVRAKKPYTAKEVAAIEQQGRDRPRPLTHDETELARANRRDARGDLRAAEAWYKAELKQPVSARKRLERARGGPVDETLNGIELGADFWLPVVW